MINLIFYIAIAVVIAISFLIVNAIHKTKKLKKTGIDRETAGTETDRKIIHSIVELINKKQDIKTEDIDKPVVEIVETPVVQDKTSPLFDHTYGVRSLGYLQEEYSSTGSFAQIWSEEYEYLCQSAYNHIKYIFDSGEYKWYFDNMVKDAKSCDDFIVGWFRPTFVKYLKKSKIIKTKKNGK